MHPTHPVMPEQYIVTNGGAYWQEMPPGKKRTWFYAPKQSNGQMDWAATVEVEASDEPVELFLDQITDPVLFLLSAESIMNHKMELYELIHAVNDALGVPIAKHTTGQAMGQYGVGFQIGGFTFDIMQDMGDGHASWLTCYNPADINKLEPGTPIEATTKYPGAFDGTTWRTADFRAWVSRAVLSVLSTEDFTYVEGDPDTRKEMLHYVSVA